MAKSFIGRKRVRKSFGRIPTVAPIPNLIEVQKSSYDQFLQLNVPVKKRTETGLQEVFKSVFPIKDFSGRGGADIGATRREMCAACEICLAPTRWGCPQNRRISQASARRKICEPIPSAHSAVRSSRPPGRSSGSPFPWHSGYSRGSCSSPSRRGRGWGCPAGSTSRIRCRCAPPSLRGGEIVWANRRRTAA